MGQRLSDCYKKKVIAIQPAKHHKFLFGSPSSTNVTILATQAKLFDGLNLSPTQVLTRDEAAQMIWNALNAYEVTYTTQTVTDANGQESIKVVREEKVIAGTTDKLTLIKDKYGIDTPPTEKKTQP